MSVAGDLKCPYCGKVNPRLSGALGLVGGLKKTEHISDDQANYPFHVTCFPSFP